MANIVPNVDGKISVATINLLWNEQVGPSCVQIFSYNGEETAEMTQMVKDLRSRFQDINTLIAKILAELPA